MANLAVLTDSGRAGFVSAMLARPLFLAWGAGDPAWEDGAAYPPLREATALVAEVGRRVATLKGFVIPDNNGSIIIPKGVTPSGEVMEARYSLSATPTPYLYMLTNFAFADAADAAIREMAIFQDCIPKPDLPPGQQYFLPSEIEEPGLMVAVQIFTPAINR